VVTDDKRNGKAAKRGERKMSDLIERYINDVIRRLPEQDRAEVRRELEASIADMLPDNPTEQQIIDVLTQLGAPNLLAEKYRQKPRYLISPAIFDSYISVLQLVVLITALVLGSLGALGAVFSPRDSLSDIISTVFASVIESAFDGALLAAFWVTLIFAIIDRTGVGQKPWTVSDLPQLANQGGVKISRAGTIVEAFLTIIFTAIFISAIARDGTIYLIVSKTLTMFPFTKAMLQKIAPLLLLNCLIELLYFAPKLYWAKWNLPLFAAHVTRQIIRVSITIYVLHWPDLFNPDFLSLISSIFANTELPSMFTYNGLINAFSFFVVLIALIDILASWSHTMKYYKNVDKTPSLAT
jgi:hypothetical protein